MSDTSKSPAKPDMIIIAHETLWESVVSDAVTFLVVVGIIGVGAWLQSTAMQWMGFIVLLMLAVARGTGKGRLLTIEQARAKLDAIEKSRRPQS